MKPDYYEILGIDRSANLQEIQQAVQLKRNAIKLALTILLDADKRRSYDAKLRPGQPNHYTMLAVSQTASPAQLQTAAQAKLKNLKEACENLASTRDYYNKLGISRSANLPDIKQAAQTRGNEVKLAFATLSRSDTRTAYDAKTNPGPHDHYTTLAVRREADLTQLKVAAQARMKEIKEAYENLSQPETRAAYDSLLPPEKPPVPRTPPLPVPPKKEDTVIQPASVFPPDEHNSQVSSHQSPTVSPTNAVSKATEIELAGRDTRLLAFIYDVVIIAITGISFVLVVKYFSPYYYVTQPLIAVFWTPLVTVIITNLVLLHRYGQTIGKRRFSIKIVNAEGSQTGLLVMARGLLVPLLAATSITTIVLVVMMFTEDLTILIIVSVIGALMVLLGSWFIFQNSQCCWHDKMAHTIVVKVSHSKKEVRQTKKEVRQRKPASKHTLLLLTFFLGWCGAHRFYLGNYVVGTFYLLLLFFWTMLPVLMALVEFLVFLFIDNDFIEKHYTAHKSAKDLVSMAIVVLFMGVVAIIPHTIYSKYKVFEALQLLGGLRMLAQDYVASTGKFPPTIEALTTEVQRSWSFGEYTTIKTSGKYTASLASNPEGFYLEATMKRGDIVLGGKTLRLVYLNSLKIWSCSATYPNRIPSMYLPRVCKEPANTSGLESLTDAIGDSLVYVLIQFLS